MQAGAYCWLERTYMCLHVLKGPEVRDVTGVVLLAACPVS